MRVLFRLKHKLCFLCIVGFVMVLLLSSATPEDQNGHVNDFPVRHASTRPPKKVIRLYNASLCNSFDQVLGIPEAISRTNCGSDCAWMTCNNFLNAKISKEKYQQTRKWMQSHPRITKKHDNEYAKLLDDCDKLKRDGGYPTLPYSKEELDFPIAFNILVHQDVEHVERLLRSIYFPQNIYCIHIDEKQSDIFKNALRSLARCFPNVFVPSKTERIVYAGFSRLKADINCMEDLVKLPANQWKYLLNVAGQSMPLRSNLEMVKILKIYNGANDIEGMYKFKVIHGRLDQEWKEFDPLYDKNVTTAHINKTGHKNPPAPHDIDIVRGSAYGVFSRPFVEWLLKDEKAQALLEWSRKTYSPDEHYWSTLHHTYSNPHLYPPGGYSGIPQEKPWLAVYVAWGGQAKCHGQWKRGICILGVEDLPSLITRNEFFVNKFHIDYQYLGMDCLEMWVKHKNECPTTMDLQFYKKLPFIKKQSTTR